MTLDQFAEVFALLAVQLRFTDADEATIRGYFEALKDLDLELVQMAAREMGKGGGAMNGDRHWFPKTSEWRERVSTVETARTIELDARLRKRLRAGEPPLCGECDDTGWRPKGDRYERCPCRHQRRLEILGRRPMPLLPEAPDAHA